MMRLAGMCLIVLLGGCGLFRGDDPVRGDDRFPDLASPDAPVETTTPDERAQIIADLQSKATRAGLDRDVVTLHLAGRLPPPLRIDRDPLIPPRLRRLAPLDGGTAPQRPAPRQCRGSMTCRRHYLPAGEAGTKLSRLPCTITVRTRRLISFGVWHAGPDHAMVAIAGSRSQGGQGADGRARGYA